MIAAAMIELLAAADDDGGSAFLLLLGPAGGVAVYFGLWRYYRNTHVSHSFERETRIQAQPITGHDAKVNEVKGTKRTQIDGDNSSNHRQRVRRLE
jgi:DNA polymerase IIIc chi subunit